MRLFKIRPGRLDTGPVPSPAVVSHVCDVPVPLTVEHYVDLYGLRAPQEDGSQYAAMVADRVRAVSS